MFDPVAAELAAERSHNELQAQMGNPNFQGCLGCEFYQVTPTNYWLGDGELEEPVCTAPPDTCEGQLAYQ